MLRRIVPAVVLGCAGLLGSLASAQEKLATPPAEPPPAIVSAPCAAPCAPAAQKTINLDKVYTYEVQDAGTRERVKERLVEVAREKRCTLELDWKEEKRTIIELVEKKRTVEKEVCYTVMEEVADTDCKGQPCKVWKPVPKKEKVTLTVIDLVPEPREIVVKMPFLKPKEEEFIVKKFVLDCTTEPVIVKRMQMQTQPNSITVPTPCLTVPCLPK